MGRRSKIPARVRFATALSLSFNNLRTKKGRTALTAFAGAIGIIGIALILSLSTGMNDYISKLESDTMGTYPIELEQETMSIASVADQGGPSDEEGDSAAAEGTIASNNVVADSVTANDSMTSENNLGAFKTYLDGHAGDLDGSLAAVEYGYDVTPQAYRQATADEGDLGESMVQVSPSTLSTDASASSDNAMASMMSSSTSSAWAELVDDDSLRSSQYTLLAGSWPEEANEVALVVDGDGLVSDYTLYTMGLLSMDDMNNLVSAVENGEDYTDEQASFAYDEVLGLEYRVYSSSALYEYDEATGAWADMSEDDAYLSDLYASGAGTTVKVTAILQATDDADVSSGVVYTKKLTTLLMEQAAASEVVQAQLADPETNVLTGEAFDGSSSDSGTSNNSNGVAGETGAASSADASSPSSLFATDDSANADGSSISSTQLSVLMAQMSSDTPSTYEDVLAALGYASVDEPTSIALYPTDFEGKTAIEGFIETYNAQVENEADKVTYTDLVGTMTSAITSVVDIVSAILVAFTSISLVVSSIMIAIITYISVLERTKEIGILRAIGASKRDVSKIFNAETVIEGLCSGAFGVAVTLLLCIPINAAINSMFGVDGIASLPAVYCLALIAISVVLTLVAGWIPSRIAAKKDPVQALRSE